MNVNEAISTRRAFRSLEPTKITEELIYDLANNAKLAPSCKNSQPWRFVFVYEKTQLKEIMKSIISPNDKWVKNASLIIAVFSHIELDCIIKERLYYLYDTGIASAFLILRATELGLIAHPIAGFEEDLVKKILNIPKNMRVISLIIVGKKASKIDENLTDMMKSTEARAPDRLRFKEFAYLNAYS